MSDEKRHLLTRREFIIVSVLGVSATMIAGVLPAHGGKYPEPKAKLNFFSAKEFTILTAIAAQFIAGAESTGIAPEDIALRIDELIVGGNEDVKTKFKLMLALVEHGTFIFSFKFSRFTRLSREAQHDYLKGWGTSRLTFRRSVFQAFKKTCLNLFFQNEKSWKLINYKGPLV